MNYYSKLLGTMLLGVGAFALYKSGILRPVTKTLIAKGIQISDWTCEKVEQVKAEYQCLREEAHVSANTELVKTARSTPKITHTPKITKTSKITKTTTPLKQ